MLKKEIEEKLDAQEKEIFLLKDKVSTLEQEKKTAEERLEELEGIDELYIPFESVLGLGSLNYIESNVFEQCVGLLKGMQNGRGNIQEFTKFLDLCFERYKIIP